MSAAIPASGVDLPAQVRQFLRKPFDLNALMDAVRTAGLTQRRRDAEENDERKASHRATEREGNEVLLFLSSVALWLCVRPAVGEFA
jgi:FixJ family two-component response regulator